MRSRSLAVTLVVLATLGMSCGALSAVAATNEDPLPSATGSSQVGFQVPDTSAPSPSPGTTGGTGSGGTAPGGAGSGGTGSGGTGTGTGGVTPACVPSTSTPTLAPQPAPSPAPLHVRPQTVAQGQDVLVTASGFQPGEKVVITLYSAPAKLGVFTVRTNGQVYADVTIPKRTQLGTHTIQVTGFQDCRVAAETISVVSPHGSGSSVFPWVVWAVAGGAVALSCVGLLIALLLGWLPITLGFGAARVIP